jgi:hypothetical protein
MINLSVLAADSTAWLKAFVLFIRYELTTLDAVSFLFANGLFSYHVRLVPVKICTTLNCLLQDSQGIRTLSYEHGGTAIQSLRVF